MRERTFEVPSVRKILSLAGVALPSRITDWKRYTLELIDAGVLVYVGDNYKEAVETRENLGEGKIALYPSRFRIPMADSNSGIKSLDRMVKIDSQLVLREVSKTQNVPQRLTKEFLEANEITPFILISKSMKYIDIENPPLGFYWVGADAHIRGTTPLRCIAGAEMKVRKEKGDFRVEVTSKKVYGRSLMVRVASRDEMNVPYDVDLFNLPMHVSEDLRRYSDWINVEHRSTDPDASFRGSKHEQRQFPGIFWSASVICAFYEAMDFVKQIKDPRQFKINPFPIPRTARDIKFIDDLRLNSLIFAKNESGELELRVLNKTEMDAQILARTKLRGYNTIWTHGRGEGFDFLYTPNYYKSKRH